MNLSANTICVIFLAIISSLPVLYAKENIVGKTSSVITSSNFASSSSNINGMLNSASKVGSSVIKSSSDIKGNDGIVHQINPKVQGINVEAVKTSSGHEGKNDEKAVIGTRFDSFQDDGETGTANDLHTAFVEVQGPNNRRRVSPAKFEGDYEHPQPHPGLPDPQAEETRRLLYEILNRLNHYRTRPGAWVQENIDNQELRRRLHRPIYF